MSHSALELALGIVETIIAFVLLWATLRITTHAGLANSQNRWALFRRVVYGSQAVALFGLGLSHLESFAIPDSLRYLFQFVIMFGVAAFPVLRATNWITQDQFKAVDGSYQRQSGRR